MKLIIAWVLLVATSARATPAETIVLFDALCIGTEGNIELIEKMIVAFDGKPIPPKLMSADQATAQHGGNGFIFTRYGKKYLVAATITHACSILAKDISATEVGKLLVTNYSLSKPQQDSTGPQVVTVWRISAPPHLKNGAIVLNAAKPGFGADDAISLGFIPAAVVQNLKSKRE